MGNPLGACTWLWTASFGDRDVALAARAAGLGFDVLEVCVETTDGLTAEALVAAGETAPISFTVCGAFGPERDLAHPDPGPRRTAQEYLAWCVELAAGIGAPLVCGPMYSAVGKDHLEDRDARAAERARAVDGLRRAADHAGERGVRLALEPLNRYETDLVNTTEQGLELCAEVDSPSLGLLLDTYHMNIEEKSLGAAIRAAGDRIFHFHACENDRGTPGTGHVRWGEVVAALRDVAYSGPIVIESFTPSVREIARAVSLWRPLDADGDTLAAEGRSVLAAALAA